MALAGMVFALGAGPVFAQTAPEPPTGVTAKPGDRMVELSWGPPGDGGGAVASFQVRHAKTIADLLNESWTAVEGLSSARMHSFTTLDNNDQYYLEVRSVGTGDSPKMSTAVRVRATPMEPPSAPAGFTAAPGDKEVKLTWEAPATGTVDYHEYRYVKGSAFASATAGWRRVRTSGTTITVSGLENISLYTFELRATKSGVSSDSASATAIPVGKPSAPLNLTVVESLNTAKTVLTVSLSWDAPATDGGSLVTRYEYKYTGVGWLDAGNTFSVEVTPLTPGTTYVFEVRAINASGAGPPVRSDGTTGGGGPTTPQTPGTAYGKGAVVDLSIAGVTPKNIDGMSRMHIVEAQHTSVTVTLEWTDEELESIWTGIPAGGKPAPAEVVVKGMIDAMDERAWLSTAELEHDVNIFSSGRTILVPIPAVPTSSRSARETGMVQFTVGQDDDAEAEAFWLVVENEDAFGSRRNTFKYGLFVIEDDEVQGIVLSEPSGTIYEGGPNVQFTVKAKPERVDLPLDVRFDLTDVTGQTVASRDNTISVDDSTIGTGAAMATVTLSLDDNDGNRENDKLKLMATVVQYALDTGAYEGITSQYEEFTVLDVHMLPPLTATATTYSVTEGDEVELTLTLDRNPTRTIVIDPSTQQITSEAVDVVLSAGAGAETTADMDDYELPSTVTFGAHAGTAPWEQTMKVKVKALANDDLGEESLVLDGEVAGTAAENGTVKNNHSGLLTLTISDGTVKQVEPETEANVMKAVDEAMAKGAGDEGLNPGESFSVKVTDLFKEKDGYAVDYDFKVSGDAVTAVESNGDVVVSAAEVGESTVTVTAKASMSMSSALATRQTSADSAEVDFDVMVVNKKLMVTVAADPTTVEEGGTSIITASVEGRAVHANDGTVKIDLTVDGDATLSADSITIMAEAMKGSVTLTATPDDDYDDETVTVTYSGAGIDGQKQLMISVMDPDEATPTVRAKTDAAAKIAAAIEKAAGGAEWMVGGMVAEVEMDGLFDLDEGVTAIYQGTSSDSDVVKEMSSGNTLMLTPMGAGMATIKVTGADNAAGGSAAAEVTYEATVVLMNLTMTVTVEPMAIEEGGMATITAKASRMVAMGDGMVKVNLSVVGEATLSSEMIEIKEDSDTGTATLTSTDDEMHEPDGEKVTLVASGAGIDGNQSFVIMVTDNDAASVDVTFMLSGPEDMNLPEGDSAPLTATATPAVEADTEIMIMRDGASTAGADDYTAESIMIKAGETTGTTMVMAVEDNEPDSGAGSPEMLTLYGMVGNMQTNSVSFYLWDAAVPALPVIAQLLLAAFLAIGGYRRYRRR